MVYLFTTYSLCVLGLLDTRSEWSLETSHNYIGDSRVSKVSPWRLVGSRSLVKLKDIITWKFSKSAEIYIIHSCTLSMVISK
jgi:hypothetical protein